MTTDGSLQSRAMGALPRLVTPVGLALAALLFIFGTAAVFRESFAAFLIEDALNDAGLRGVEMNVTRVTPSLLTVEDLQAEDGALRIARIEARYSLLGLVSSRLEALAVDGANATLTWDRDGVKLGSFQPNPDSGPLTLPYIGELRAENMTLVMVTPSVTLRAPLSIRATPSGDGWDAVVNGAVEGKGVHVALAWEGVIAPSDLSRSSGNGRFDLAVDDFLIPNSGNILDANGQVTLSAANGVFAVALPQPLVFSTSPAAPAREPSLLKTLEQLPWSLTIAPSPAKAALVFTASGETRGIRVDVAAAGRAGSGEIDFAFLGEAARSAQSTEFHLAKAHANLRAIPFGGGHVSGNFTIADFTGSGEGAKGKIAADFAVAGVTLAEAALGQADMNFASSLSIADGRFTLELETLRLNIAEGGFGGWVLAAPAQLSLAATSAASPHRITIGAFGLSNSADLALIVPELALRGAKDADARLTLRAPDVRLTASSSGLSLDGALAATRIDISHPAGEVRDARVDLKGGGGEVTGSASGRITRIGPARESDTPSGALLTTATVVTKGDDLVLRGSFSTAAGAKLGDYSAQVSADFARGTASFSLPATKVERGGKIDPADLAFIAPVSDLSGSFSIEAKRSWTGARATESAMITLENVGFAVGEISVAGLSTTVDLSAFAPPRSTKTHQIAALSIAAGLPLTALAADYILPGDGTAVIKHGTADVAGGQITLADAVVPLDGRDGAFSVGVRKLDMGALAAQAKVEGLSVVGTLSGAIPLRSGEDGYRFADGLLRADGPGRIVYRPAAPPAALSQNQGGALLLQALSNFAYDRLSLTLNGPISEEISLLVAIAGKNPDLYGGYPIEFNLNLSGRLTEILKQGLVSAGIPADLERQLRQGRLGQAKPAAK